ncbi:MAG: SMP-30/gluconolactonase/LRE family protein [Neptuniibacter sp.]
MRYISVGLAALLISCSSCYATKLDQNWQINGGLKQPESIVQTEDGSGFYVSNINGQPSAFDGNGFISIISMSGKIKELKWIDGLNAPKGMISHLGKLYVADINELLEIDINTKTITKRFKVPKEAFLNDVAVDKQGSIYVSDTANNRIYLLSDGDWHLWLEDPLLENPNGLYIEDNRLLVTSWGKTRDSSWITEIPGHIQSISLQDKKISDLINNNPIGNLDGLVKIDNETYMVSDWMNGKILKIDKNGSINTVLELDQGSADMLYIPGSNHLLIPQMIKNSLISYTVR